MCTLTYIPRPGQTIITVNRDEAPSRAAAEPEIREKDGRRFWLAPEPVSGGSNLVLDIINHRLLVLLNGAFKPHEHKPPYRLSRGVMMMEAFRFESLAEMKRQYAFEGIEPFTLLSYQNGAWEEMRWDGTKTHPHAPPTDKSEIWSSAKLYRPKDIEQRESSFFDYIERSRALYPQQLFDIHQRDQNDPRGFGFRMNYEDRVKTVSITQVLFENGRVLLRYMDLMREPKMLLERSF